MSRSRALLAMAAAAATVAVFGCDSKVGTAAYVGGEKISADELDAAVEEGMDDPDVRTNYIDGSLDGDLAAYRRMVLSNQVQSVLVSEAADRLDVSVSDTDVNALVDNLAAQDQQDARTFFADRGLTERAGREVARSVALLPEIGAALGDSDVRRLHEANPREFLRGFTVAPVPASSEAEADQIAEAMRSDPTLASRNQTEVSVEQLGRELPALLDQLLAAEEGDTVVFQQSGQYVVVHVAEWLVTPVEMVIDRIRGGSGEQATQVGELYLSEVARELEVRINPRYGTWDYQNNTIADLDDPLVELSSPEPSAPPGVPQAGN